MRRPHGGMRLTVRLTFCVKRDLYVGNGDGSRPFEGGSSRVVWGRNATETGEPAQGAWGQAGCETEIESGDEIVRVPGATDAPSATWPVALPPLALSRRPALARARAARWRMLPERARAFHRRPSHHSAPAPRRLRRPGRRDPGGGGASPIPSDPRAEPAGSVGMGRVRWARAPVRHAGRWHR